MHPGPVLVRNFTRVSKHDDLVQQAELSQANPAYAKVRYPDGREVTVSLENLAPAPRNTVDSCVKKHPKKHRRQETPSTREVTVSLEDLTPAPRNTVDKTRFNEVNADRSPNQAEISSTFDNAVDNRVLSNEAADNKEEIENHAADEMQFVRPNELDTPLRRSERRNKGVPPMRYGNALSF